MEMSKIFHEISKIQLWRFFGFRMLGYAAWMYCELWNPQWCLLPATNWSQYSDLHNDVLNIL